MGTCVKKEVKMMKSSSDDCPRLSVRPGKNSYSGVIHNLWVGDLRMPNMSPIDNQINTSSSSGKMKKVKSKQLSSNSRYRKEEKLISKPLRLSGFFKAQLRFQKIMKSSKLQKKGKLSSKKSAVSSSGSPKHGRIVTSVPNQIIISSNCPILKKHKGKMPTIHDLPNELLAEILKRLPVKYILRCRCVQKSWHSLIKSSMFITLQLNYQKKNISTTTTTNHHHSKYLFFQNQFSVKLTVRFDDVQCQKYCKIEFPPGLPIYAWFAASYGLVCVSSTLRAEVDCDRNIYLWNPLIQKYKILPDSPLPSKQDWEEWEALAFGFLPEVNDYVVVHIIKPYLHSNSHSVIIGVYSLNTNSWKKLSRDNVFISRLYSHDNDVVFVNGAAYWVGVNPYKHKILMCFDTKTDILSEISLPDWLAHEHLPVIYPFGQSIAYFVWEHRVNHLDMWVLKDDLTNGFIWEKKMCVSTSEDVQAEVLGVRNNGEPILAKFNNFITYNLDSHEANDFVDSWDCWTPESPYREGFGARYAISPFVESLVLFDAD